MTVSCASELLSASTPASDVFRYICTALGGALLIRGRDVLDHVGGRGVSHGLRLAAAVDGESEVDSHRTRAENGEHGDGGEDQDGPALLFPVPTEPGPEALHQETVPS